MEMKSRPPNIDLSSLRHVINAAEPVDAGVLKKFCLTFASFGLDPTVIFPTYGLAEHTVFVCSGGKQVLTVSKRSLTQTKVEILDARERERGDGRANGEQKRQDGGAATGSKELISEIVGCGYPSRGDRVEVLIVDPETSSVLSDDWVRFCLF